MTEPIRNRIKAHRRVRAGDLVPHELNFRLHPERQRAAVEALYRKIGRARSLLVYELPDGRLKLIDGHLRRELHPDWELASVRKTRPQCLDSPLPRPRFTAAKYLTQ